MKKMTRTSVLVLTLTIVLAAVTLPLGAQDKPADNMQLVRDKVKADKKLLVAENMEFTEAQAEAFWPVYDSFQSDLGELNDRMLKLVERYAQNFETMTEETARTLTEDYLSVEADRLKLLQSYLPKISKAVGDKKAARYVQLENKISAIVRFELAARIPLVQ